MLHPHSNDHPFLFTRVPEQITDDAAYHTWQPINYSSRAAKTAQNYRTYKSMGPLRLNPSAEEDSDSPSGVYLPPLWKTTGNEDSKNKYPNLSPASRTQAIARGQRELMEMVRNMPESCYELSLKDLVERGTTMADVDEEDFSTEIFVKREDGKVNKKKKKKVMRRSGSIDRGGFLLKMVFPISMGSNQKSQVVIRNKTMKKNKSDLCEEEDNEKVSGRPCVDKDWWKKRVLASRGSAGGESGVSSLNSGSIKSSSSTGSSSSSCSSRCSTRRKTGGCWSFILLKKKRQA